MDFDYAPNVKALQKTLSSFMEEFIYPNESALIAEDERADALIVELQQEAKAAGLWAPHLPPDAGGSGGGFIEYAYLNEEIGRSFIAQLVFGCQAPDAGNGEILHLFGTPEQKKQLTEEEKEYKSKRKLVQEKLIKFATRIPAFMYLTDFRENTLQDVITKIEPDLFETVTGLTVKDFHLLVRLKVFNTEQMNQAVFAFRRYEDASLRYTGIESHEGLTHYGLYDTVVAKE